MAERILFLTDKHDIVSKEKARWKVIHKYDANGRLKEEVWVDLKASK